ncbi:MAG: thioredoxin-disulfide reductase [Chitinophagales bacterium]|jgi:thioredoxin reductase (NADPH)|nr:thioredoxin-disulfide reductase [Chitinophagales bacterium]MBP9221052.1 thioredoxin-disulfide reductase [Chitinophagales bacterium]
MEIVKCLIIGSGPAGYTAAIYAARANLKPIMYTGIEPGGQLMQTTDVENFPGYPNGILGPEMMEDLKKQAERFGTDVRFGIATRVELSGKVKKVFFDDGTSIEAYTVIICTGASAKWLGLESEKRLNGNGVSACAVCDGFFFRNQEVALVGAGDTACEEALYLAKLCTTVHMIVRKDHFRASKIMQDRVLNTPNIKVYWNSETVEVIGDGVVTAVKIKNTNNNEITEIPITGFFVAIGHQPNTSIFEGIIDMDAQKYIVTKNGSTKTNIEGVFAAGDVQDKHYRQAVTAAGTGCMAALDAERYLTEAGIE